MKYFDFANAPAAGQPERLVVAIDVSPSMEDTDWPPSRLAAAIAAVIALIQRKCRIAPADEVAIVTYGSTASVLCPLLTVGQRAENMIGLLDSIETHGGTNITAALTEAGRVLSYAGRSGWLDVLLPPAIGVSHASARRVILLTDGEFNTGGSPLSVALALKKSGVCIDCVGIGGDPSAVNEADLRTIASRHADGVTPRYTFIGDKGGLIKKFEELAGRISR
ncbi:MAG: VWA domain-containing protein [Planctomycetes bacterium]|nr:VWA domain-containing protein [Planctomycetota bacterium]